MSPREQAIEERKAFVRANYLTMTARAMAEHCGVATSCIESLRHALKLKKSNKPRPAPWTPEQTKKLVLLYASHSNESLAVLFGRTEDAIYSKAAELRLKKSSELRAVIALAAADRMRDAQKIAAANRRPSPMESQRVHSAQKLRITYTPETLPYKARAMAQPWTPPNLTYRGQVAA